MDAQAPPLRSAESRGEWKIACAAPCRPAAAGSRPVRLPGGTRWAVRAFSVVLMPQICRSWTSLTPGRSRRYSRTSPLFTDAGTACSARSRDSRISDHVPQMIMPPMARLTAGSSHAQPVTRIDPAGHHHAERHQRVRRHVSESGPDVDVALAAGREHQRGGPVDEHTDEGDGHHGQAAGRRGMQQLEDGGPGDPSGHHQQHDGVAQGRED